MNEDLSREALELRTRNRHRMIGAAILMLVLVVVVPQFLEHAVFPKSVKTSAGLVMEKGISAPVEPTPPAPVAGPPMPVEPVTVTEIPATSPIANGGIHPPVPTDTGEKPAEVPHGPSAKTTTAASGPEKVVTPAAKGVLLQAGVFHNASKAQTLSAHLNEQGFHSRVEKQSDSGTPVYRVLLGPMKTRAEAAEVKARLEKIQISVLVKPQK